MLFRCLISGNTVEFTNDADIQGMLSHHQYEIVESEENKEDIAKVLADAPQSVKHRIKDKAKK